MLRFLIDPKIRRSEKSWMGEAACTATTKARGKIQNGPWGGGEKGEDIHLGLTAGGRRASLLSQGWQNWGQNS